MSDLGLADTSQQPIDVALPPKAGIGKGAFWCQAADGEGRGASGDLATEPSALLEGMNWRRARRYGGRRSGRTGQHWRRLVFSITPSASSLPEPILRSRRRR
jgi:hypothetical protein